MVLCQVNLFLFCRAFSGSVLEICVENSELDMGQAKTFNPLKFLAINYHKAEYLHLLSYDLPFNAVRIS